MKRVPDYNWIPESFEEFRRAVRQGRVELNIMGRQYPWLYGNVLPWSPYKKDKYEKRLLRRMEDREDVFRRVHDYGIDLVLHQEPIGDGQLRSNVERENRILLVLTLIGLVAGVVLWFYEWHWAIAYALPALVFGIGGSLANFRRDDPDQIGRWTYPLWSVVWPLAFGVYFLVVRDRS